MADAPKTSLARLLSSLPLPDAPYERIEDPIVAQYLRRLHTYLQDLLSKFGVAEANGFTLPPIPDATNDWFLEGISQTVVWYKKPAVSTVTPTIDDDHTGEFDEALGDIAWFSNGATMEAGSYLIGYDSGAVDYSGDGNFRLNSNAAHGYTVVYQNANLYALIDPTFDANSGMCQDYDGTGTKIVNQIAEKWLGLKRVNFSSDNDDTGFDATHGKQYGVEAAFAGQFTVVNHDGSGPIGMRLYDSPRNDNVIMPGGSATTFFIHRVSIRDYYKLL